MLLSSTSTRFDSIGQLFTVTLIFLFVLALTYFATKFTAGIQKGRLAGSAVELLETVKIAPTKYIQVVRIGKKYFTYVLCKDTVTLLGEMTEDDMASVCSGASESVSGLDFREIFDRIRKKK